MNRRNHRTHLPTASGWYQAGPDHLRYFNGDHWTEQIRPLPRFSDIPGIDPHAFDSLAAPVRAHRLRKIFALIALAVLAISIMTQATGMMGVALSTPTKRSSPDKTLFDNTPQTSSGSRGTL